MGAIEDKLNRLMTDGQAASDGGNLPEAIRLWRQAADGALAASPCRPETACSALVRCGRAHACNNNSDSTKQAFDAASAVIQRFKLFNTTTHALFLAGLAEAKLYFGDMPGRGSLLEEARNILLRAADPKQAFLLAELTTQLASFREGERKHREVIDLIAEAYGAFRQSAVALQSSPHGHSLEHLQQMILAKAHLELKDHVQARACADRAIRTAEGAFGKDSFYALEAHLCMSRVLMGPDPAEAERHVCIVVDRPIPSDPRYAAIIADATNYLGLIRLRRSEFAEAQNLFERCLACERLRLPPHHPTIATALNNIAFACREQGKLVESETHQDAALKMYEKTVGVEHPLYANALKNLALLRHRQGSSREAEEAANHALAIMAKALGGEHESTLKMRQQLSPILGAS
ncbi:MAG TPA: tetratricopeptide repeat protein [Humisphaera sp.]|jgi:tetratricopeptide (TPR) repeat protein|nr:tetratricopeptide repeat protein [Humisphaera sp.]